MKAKVKLGGSEKLQARFVKSARLAKSGDVEVGYTADYAMPVHEMVGASFQAAGTQAKFLEEPFRRLKDDLVSLMKTSMERGVPLVQSAFIAGLFLQRESQTACPVDTGNLRASAFTRKVK